MNRIRVVLLAGLFLGTAAFFANAQEPKPDEPRQEPKPEERRPAQDETKPPKQEKPEERESNKLPKDHAKQEHEKDQAKPEQTGQMPHGRPAGKSVRIPDDKFRANFGRQHSFTVKQVITTRTVVVNQTNFVYSGYTFVFLDPWPSEWLFTDDCYVDYVDDEYFLIDVMHPGIRVALFVQM